MVILHDAIKTTQNGVLVFKKKRTENCFFSKKQTKKLDEKNRWVIFFKKTFFFLKPDCLSILSVIFP